MHLTDAVAIMYATRDRDLNPPAGMTESEERYEQRQFQLYVEQERERLVREFLRAYDDMFVDFCLDKFEAEEGGA